MDNPFAQTGLVELDLHGKTVVQARTAINAALRRADSGVYRLRLIHGYRGGDRLREMIWTEYPRHRQVRRLAAAGWGATDLILREL